MAEVKVGDLVRLTKEIHHTGPSGPLLPGRLGVVVEIKSPTIQDPRLIAEVIFDNDEQTSISCLWHELEVVSS